MFGVFFFVVRIVTCWNHCDMSVENRLIQTTNSKVQCAENIRFVKWATDSIGGRPFLLNWRKKHFLDIFSARYASGSALRNKITYYFHNYVTSYIVLVPHNFCHEKSVNVHSMSPAIYYSLHNNLIGFECNMNGKWIALAQVHAIRMPVKLLFLSWSVYSFRCGDRSSRLNPEIRCAKFVCISL